MVLAYRSVLDLSVILGVLCVGLQGQSYVARRVPTLDDVLFAQTNAFTVPSTSLAECIMSCGELKAGCLSVVYHRNNKFCRGYPVVFETVAGTVPSLGAEFYIIKYDAPCPYNVGYSMFGGFCLRAVTTLDPVTWFEAGELCERDGGALFNSSTTTEETALQELMSEASSSIYYLGNGDVSNDQCEAINLFSGTRVTLTCSTDLHAAVCVV